MMMDDLLAKVRPHTQKLLQAMGIVDTGFYEPVKMQEMRAVMEKTRIAGMLPYQDYYSETQLFRLDEGIGFTIEVAPQTGANTEMSRILAGLFMSCPVGTGVQIQMFAGTNFKRSMDQYVQMREVTRDVAPIYYTMAKRRAAYYVRGSKKRLFPTNPYLLRNFRTIVSVTMPGDITNLDHVDDATLLRSSMTSTLNSAGFASRAWNADDMLQWTSTLLNLRRYHDYDHPDVTYDPGRHLRDQIVDFDQLARVQDSGIVFGREQDKDLMEARFYSVKSYPQSFGLWAMRNLLGDYFQGALQYTTPYLITLGVHILDYEQTKSTAQMKSARATTNASSYMAQFLPELAEKKKDWDIVMKSLGDGHNMVSLTHELMLFGHPSEMAQAEQAAKAVWRARAFEICNDQFVQIKGLILSLPMTLSKSFIQDLGKMGAMTTKTTDNAVAMAPMISEWNGTKTPTIKLFGRLGQAMDVDFFDNTQGNYNVAIAGVSGSGKSVFLNNTAESYLGTGCKVWIIDVGRSYEKLCKHVGGEFIEFTPDKAICMNPFTFVVDLEEDLAMLKPVIAQMIAPSRTLDDFERSHLEMAIRGVWRDKQNSMTITDVAAYLKAGSTIEKVVVPEGQRRGSDLDRRVTDLGAMLYPFTKDGQFGKYFEGEATTNFDKQFVVLELEELKSKKDLQTVVLLIMILRISQEMYLQRDTRKLVIIDEAWSLMDGGSTAEFIETGYRRARKYNGSFVTATQGWDDFYKNDAAKAALQNSDWTFMLRQKEESIESLVSNKRIVDDEYVKRVMKSLRTEHGSFAEIYIGSQVGNGIGRLIINPLSLLMYSTRAEDFNDVNVKVESGMSYQEALEAVLVDRGIEVC